MGMERYCYAGLYNELADTDPVRVLAGDRDRPFTPVNFGWSIK